MQNVKRFVCLLLVLFFCTGCAIQAASPDITPAQIAPNATATPSEDASKGKKQFSWVRPSSEMFGFDGVYAQLYDIIVDDCQADNTPERCSIPEVQVFWVDERNGAYYCTVTSTSLYYQENDPFVLDLGGGGYNCKIDTLVENGKLIAADINYLSLDGMYESTKEQLEKIPGLFEAYQNKNMEPMEIYWKTPTREELVREYFNQTDYDFLYVLISSEKKFDFFEWLNSEIS